MKTPWTINIVSGCLAAATLLTACSEQPSCCPAPTNPSTQQKPMHPVVGQLDLDGEFLLYMDTSTIEKSITDYVDTLVSVAKTSAAPSEAEQIEAVAQTVKDALLWSGLLSIDSFSMSTKDIEGDLSRIISIAEHDESDAEKALWRIMASEPSVLKGIQYAPADSVYAINSTSSLDELWKVLNEALDTYFPAEARQELDPQLAMIEAMLGTSLDELLGSLDAEILLSIQLSETKTSTFPVGTESIVIPEPSLIIGLQTKDPAVSQLLLAKLKEAQAPVVESKHGDYTLNIMNLPIPLPCPVAPTLVQTEDYLLIGTHPDAVTQALDSRANQNGLIASPLYKQLLADAPEKTSGIEFLSPRLIQTYMDSITTAAGASVDADQIGLLKVMMERYQGIQSASYLLKTPKGLYSYSLGNYGAANPGEVIISAGAGYVGLMAAIAIPSFQKARTTSREKSCINNMRMLEAAKEQWAMENNKMDGSAVVKADINDWIRGGAEALECPAGGTYTLGTIGTMPECSEHGTR